jgi:glutamine synthetase adenylyltransferase
MGAASLAQGPSPGGEPGDGARRRPPRPGHHRRSIQPRQDRGEHAQGAAENRLSTEVKLGPGGIRTIEFYVQYLQVLHGQALPELISGNTLSVLGRLYRYRLLSPNYHDLLSKSYVFLRRIEHVLQLQGLQQRHELPASPVELEKLAKRMGFEERLGQSASTQFRARYRQHMLTLLELSGSLFGYETNLPAPGESASTAIPPRPVSKPDSSQETP